MTLNPSVIFEGVIIILASGFIIGVVNRVRQLFKDVDISFEKIRAIEKQINKE